MAFQYLKGLQECWKETLYQGTVIGQRVTASDWKRFRMEIRTKFFTVRVVRHWNTFPAEVVDTLSLKAFKAKSDGALSCLV